MTIAHEQKDHGQKNKCAWLCASRVALGAYCRFDPPDDVCSHTCIVWERRSRRLPHGWRLCCGPRSASTGQDWLITHHFPPPWSAEPERPLSLAIVSFILRMRVIGVGAGRPTCLT